MTSLMKTKYMSSLLVLISMSAAQAGDFQFACTDASSKLIIAGTSVSKIGHFVISATAQINGGAKIAMSDSNEASTSYGATFQDSTKTTQVRVLFGTTYANGAYTFSDFAFGHIDISSDGTFNSVATVTELNGENLSDLSNIPLNCLGTITEKTGDGFKSFWGKLANGVGNALVCAAFPQDCQD
jgi:hypothetical protein